MCLVCVYTEKTCLSTVYTVCVYGISQLQSTIGSARKVCVSGWEGSTVSWGGGSLKYSMYSLHILIYIFNCWIFQWEAGGKRLVGAHPSPSSLPQAMSLQSTDVVL